jgi:wyosine [tRNA(Phe)-imidazoG37] synthetase (radical SAM superfamily)
MQFFIEYPIWVQISSDHYNFRSYNFLEIAMGIRLQKEIVYGPIQSRRLGISLGVNLLSPFHKICSFDCVYCHYGRSRLLTDKPDPSSIYTPEQILKELEIRLKSARHLDSITFSGNGEPTLHPNFAKIVKETRKLRDRFQPGVPLAVFTNGSTLSRQDVRSALESIAYPLVKLDAGNQLTFEMINRPVGSVDLHFIIESMKGLKGLILRSLFHKGNVSNHTGPGFEAWVEAVGEINPVGIQITTLDGDDPQLGLQSLVPFELNAIAERINSTVGIKAEAFWTPTTWVR